MGIDRVVIENDFGFVSKEAFLSALHGLFRVYQGRKDACIRLSPYDLKRLLNMAGDGGSSI